MSKVGEGAPTIRPIKEKSQYGQAPMLRTRKDSEKAIARKARAFQRVGLFRQGASQAGLLDKTSAKRETVRPHIRRSGGKIVAVKGHTRRGPEEKPTPDKAQAQAAARHKGDLEAWKKWNAGGRTRKDLKALLDRFRPMIQAQAGVYKNKVPIPPAAIDAEYKRQFVRALHAYDPAKGKLGTWVYRYLSAAKRFITTHQNPARIPEGRIYDIGKFERAKSHLDDVYGRPATPQEMSDYLGWPLKQVTRLRTEMRKGLTRSAFERDPTSIMPSREKEVLDLIRFELAPEEQEVYDYLAGIRGKKQVRGTDELAKLTGKPNYKISRIKKSIAKKVERYLR